MLRKRKVNLSVVLLMTVFLTAAASKQPLQVVVYRSGDCESWEEAVATVKEAVSELGVKAKVRVVKIKSAEHARQLRFHGSPSVVVNGVDVEGPAVEERPVSYG